MLPRHTRYRRHRFTVTMSDTGIKSVKSSLRDRSSRTPLYEETHEVDMPSPGKSVLLPTKRHVPTTFLPGNGLNHVVIERAPQEHSCLETAKKPL